MLNPVINNLSCIASMVNKQLLIFSGLTLISIVFLSASFAIEPNVNPLSYEATTRQTENANVIVMPLMFNGKRLADVPVTLGPELLGGKLLGRPFIDVIKPFLNDETISFFEPLLKQGRMFTISRLAELGINVSFLQDKNIINIKISKKLRRGLTNISDAILLPTENGHSRFILSLDGPVDQNVFVLAEPDRIVIDLEKTTGHKLINSKALKNDTILTVRSGTHENDKLRIVLDLNSASYADSKLLGPDNNKQYKLAINIHQIPVPRPAEKTSQNIPQSPANRNTEIIQLALNYQNAPLGKIDALDYDAGYMLPLSQLFQVLGFPINVHYESGIAEGWFFRSSQNFIMDIQKSQVIIKGKKTSFLSNLVRKRERDIFVDISLLQKFFPVSFQIDPAALSLTINPDKSLSEEKKNELIKQWLSLSGQKITPEFSVSDISPAPTTKYPGEKADIFSDDSLIVLQPSIDNDPIDDFLEAYHVGDRFLVPLKVLSDMLDFNISVSAESGKATGWFINEKRTFLLDLINKQAIKLDGTPVRFTNMQVHASGGEFFIDTTLLAQLLPLDFKVQLQKLSLLINPREALPFQIRQKRLKNWERIQRQRRKDKSYKVLDIPYEAVSIPFIDLNFAHLRKKTDLERFSATGYTLLAAGDIGHLSSTLFASGGDVDHLSSFRFNAGRRSLNPDLLGSMKATQFFTGDINSITVPLVAQSSLGRGFTASNRSIYRSSQFDSTNFIGDALPGWEIELYHNGALIDFQVTGSTARYAFLDVPLRYGNNTFRLISHGPQGQIKEEIRRFNIGNAFMRQGESNYEFSIDEKSKQLIQADKSFTLNHPNKLRFAGEIEYGLTNSLVGTLGMISTPLRDGEHRYLTSGIRTGHKQILANFDFAYDQSNHGWATKLAMFTGINNHSIKAEYKLFDKFFSEEFNDFGLPFKSQIDIGYNTTLSLPYLRNLNFNLISHKDEYESGESRTILKNRISKSFYGINLTNRLEKTSSPTSDTTIGELSLRSRFLTTLLRGKLNYSLKPESGKDRVELSAQNTVFNNTLAILRWSKDYSTDNTNITGSLNWDLKHYKLNLTAFVDDSDNYTITTNLLFSLGRNPNTRNWFVHGKPIASTGAASPFAFLDNNFNNNFDEEDEAIENAVFIVNDKRNSTDKESTVITDLQINRYSTIALDPVSLDDSLWTPATAGYKFLPRPGTASSISFPVITASEIDGTVYIVDNDKVKKAQSRIEVQLVDIVSGDTVKTFKSEYDGYYLLEKVHPGKYSIRISRFDLSYLDLKQNEEIKLEIKPQSDVYSGYDIILSTIKKKTE